MLTSAPTEHHPLNPPPAQSSFIHHGQSILLLSIILITISSTSKCSWFRRPMNKEHHHFFIPMPPRRINTKPSVPTCCCVSPPSKRAKPIKNVVFIGGRQWWFRHSCHRSRLFSHQSSSQQCFPYQWCLYFNEDTINIRMSQTTHDSEEEGTDRDNSIQSCDDTPDLDHPFHQPEQWVLIAQPRAVASPKHECTIIWLHPFLTAVHPHVTGNISDTTMKYTAMIHQSRKLT